MSGRSQNRRLDMAAARHWNPTCTLAAIDVLKNAETMRTAEQEKLKQEREKIGQARDRILHILFDSDGPGLQAIDRNDVLTVLRSGKKEAQIYRNLPAEMRIDPEIISAAMQSSPGIYAEVPPAGKTPEAALAAVKGDGHLLYYVPSEQRTPEVCMEAVKKEPRALRDVPNRLKTPELCLEALKREMSIGLSVKECSWVVQHVPESIRDAVVHSAETGAPLPPGLSARTGMVGWRSWLRRSRPGHSARTEMVERGADAAAAAAVDLQALARESTEQEAGQEAAAPGAGR